MITFGLHIIWGLLCWMDERCTRTQWLHFSSHFTTTPKKIIKNSTKHTLINKQVGHDHFQMCQTCYLSWRKQLLISLQENGCKTYKRLTLKCPNQQKVLGTMDFCQFAVVQIFLSIFLSIFVNVFVDFVNLSICQFFVNFCEFFKGSVFEDSPTSLFYLFLFHV
jgi:hypothetical protein